MVNIIFFSFVLGMTNRVKTRDGGDAILEVSLQRESLYKHVESLSNEKLDVLIISLLKC